MIPIWSYLIEPVRCEVCILYWYLWHIVSTQRLTSVLNDRRCTFCSWPLGCHCCHSDVSYPVLISWSRWPLCNTVLDIFSVSVINFRVWCDPVSGVSSLLCAHATPDWTLTHHPWLDDSRGPSVVAPENHYSLVSEAGPMKAWGKTLIDYFNEVLSSCFLVP